MNEDEMKDQNKQLKEAVALLEELEWTHDDSYFGESCGICHGYDSIMTGHKPDCRLAAFLKKVGE